MIPDADHARVRASIEHTLLAPGSTRAAAESLCRQAIEQRFYAVCVHPIHVASCRACLHGSGVRLVTVIGFPSGATFSAAKAREAELALEAGADELDMVMQLGAAKAGEFEAVEADARAVVEAASGKPVKLILETGLLDEAEKRAACLAATRAGVAFVKTCSGFAPGSATVGDVELLRAALPAAIGVKASGGIRSLAQVRALLGAGATRIGTSAGLEIARELQGQVRAP